MLVNLRSVLGVALLASAGFAQTTRASVDSAGVQGNDFSRNPAISADGRYALFDCLATNLVAGDTNGKIDAFFHDLQTGQTTRVSLDSSGAEANGDAIVATISADLRYVAFESSATNLVAGDSNGSSDVFLRDLQTGQTSLVSLDSAGVQGNGNSSLPRISADGLYVVFDSVATNLVAGDTNVVQDIFVHDLVNGQTTRVNVDSTGAQANDLSVGRAISADGRFVAFYSFASNLVAGDTNVRADVFVHDRASAQTSRVSVDSSGSQGNDTSMHPSISGDGRYVSFQSLATNLVAGDTNGKTDIFLHDRSTAQTTRASVSSSGAQASNESRFAQISGDGLSIAFDSAATNLVPGDTNGFYDVFVRDLQTGLVTRASTASAGAQGDNTSTSASLSDDGRFVVFASTATTLVPGDTNASADIFVRDRQCSVPLSYCTAKVNSAGCSPFLTSTGTASASAGSGFSIDGEQVLASKAGLLFYSVSGPGGTPFQGGFLCATPPTKRTSIQTASSAGSPPCTGIHSYDFNVRIASGADPALVAGQPVWTQYWTRDAGVPSGTGLTNGLTFSICP